MFDFGAARGVQMEPNWIKNLVKNRIDFCNDFEFFFSDLGSILAPKSSPKWGVLGSFFQARCEYARSVILNNPLMVLLYFSTLRGSIFDLKMYIFRLFFRRCFEDVLFSIFGRNLGQIGGQMGAQIDEKFEKKLSWFFNEILMDFRSPRWGWGHGRSSR